MADNVGYTPGDGVTIDNAHRRYKQLQEEEDIAYVMSILAAM